MKEWFTAQELAELRLPDMPASRQGVDYFARQQHWRASTMARKREGRGGGIEYHISLLPNPAQNRLQVAALTSVQAAEKARRDDYAKRRSALWAKYEALSETHKAACETRLKALLKLDEMVVAGVTVGNAVAVVAQMECLSERILYHWRSLTDNVDRADWLAALAPSFASGSKKQACNSDAWDFLLADYLRASKPSFSACYRRMMKVAKREGWAPVPSERVLRRRLEEEVPKTVQTIAREGKDKAKALFPSQRRTKAHLHAMQIVNMDGHKLDVFVSVPWKEQPVRMYLIGIQDVYSGKIVAWRLSEAETWEAVRLVIGDMVEQFGIPDTMVLDNGRAFASKWISGQSRTRFRYKIREEDPRGLITTLGIELVWAQPYSGQSKPIERAWRDIAQIVSKHPFCAGAYTGPSPDAKPEDYASRAVPLDAFKAHVAAQIAEHNAQEGRRSETAKGRSFDETFAASLAEPTSIVRWPTSAQRSLWLLASEALKARKGNGMIHFQENRYWSPALNQYAGKKVTIRFDPDNLHKAIKVYDLDNRLICEADCLDDTGFRDVGAARDQSKARSEYLKAEKAALKAKRKLSAKELGDIIYRGSTPKAPPQQAPQRPVVTRLATAAKLKPQEQEADEFEENFSRALSLIRGEDGVIVFPKGKKTGA